MIYTITFNPSLDYVMHVDKFEEGETNRSTKEEIYPGGKGFNVSTILARLGFETTALGFIAGFSGEEIERTLLTRGFKCDLCKLDEGISRINIKMKSKVETEINASGPHINQDKLNELLTKLDKIQDGDVLVLAGSIPNSLPDNIYEQIMKLLSNKDLKIIVDATNDLLKNVLAYKPFLIKPNHRELEELFNTTINSETELIYYAKQLQEQGAQNVLVSLGSKGALLVSQDHQVLYCNSAKGTLLNSVGSGDSMVAGFIAGYLKTNDYQEALKLGSACGGASAFSEDLAQASLIYEVYQQMKVEVR